MRGLGLTFALATVLVGAIPAPLLADEIEPSYCHPDSFGAHEIQVPGSAGITRFRAFQLGRVTMAGMAIGLSSAADIEKVAELYQGSAATRYCTWYLNSGNVDAEQAFHHIYLGSPLHMTPEEAVAEFGGLMLDSFVNVSGVNASGSATFLSCMEQGGYVGLGCNGQSHRGPAVFGMILSFSGCQPDHAEDIVDALWGLNGVERPVRLSTLQWAHELGALYPELRTRMRTALSP